MKDNERGQLLYVFPSKLITASRIIVMIGIITLTVAYVGALYSMHGIFNFDTMIFTIVYIIGMSIMIPAVVCSSYLKIYSNGIYPPSCAFDFPESCGLKFIPFDNIEKVVKMDVFEILDLQPVWERKLADIEQLERDLGMNLKPFFIGERPKDPGICVILKKEMYYMHKYRKKVWLYGYVKDVDETIQIINKYLDDYRKHEKIHGGRSY